MLAGDLPELFPPEDFDVTATLLDLLRGGGVRLKLGVIKGDLEHREYVDTDVITHSYPSALPHTPTPVRAHTYTHTQCSAHT